MSRPGARPRALLGALAALSLLTGCVTTNATLLDPTATRYPPVEPEMVRIFASQQALDECEYVEVAFIEASGSGEFTDQSTMIRAMRKKAGELGANAILLPQIEEPGAGAKVAAAIFGTGTERTGQVIAIRVIGPKEEG